jgi:hypothetical protein
MPGLIPARPRGEESHDPGRFAAAPALPDMAGLQVPGYPRSRSRARHEDLAQAVHARDRRRVHGRRLPQHWHDILEFRKTVGRRCDRARAGRSCVYDTEPGYDYVTLQRRTAANPSFEPITGGQGLSWDGRARQRSTTRSPTPRPNGTKAPTLPSPSSSIPTAPGRTGTACGRRRRRPPRQHHGDAERDDLHRELRGRHDRSRLAATPNVGVGDFARVWTRLGDADDCATNYSNLVAFIDDGLVVPGTGPSADQATTTARPAATS